MKHLILAAVLGFSAQAMAISECAGRASDGSFVKLTINTTGDVAVADSGEVSIEQGANKFGYRFGKDEISQFFEYDEQSDGTAMVGAIVFASHEFPVSVKYNAPNYVDMDLKAVVDGGKVDALKGNFLRVWKGPGHAATDQIQLTKIACSVWQNI